MDSDPAHPDTLRHGVSVFLRVWRHGCSNTTPQQVHPESVLHPEHVNDLAAPSLPGALCRDEWELFDRASGGSDRLALAHAREDALQICASCPVLTACSDWFTSLPASQRPHGVVAGQIITKGSSHTSW